MPRIDLDILNQLQTPAFYASSLATRPAFGFVGRIFIDSDSPSTGIYRDTGTSWIQIADQTGIIVTPTLQSVTTAGNTSNVGISVSANGIGIGTTIPASNRLDIHSASGINATFNGTGTTNAALQLQSAGVGKWTLQNNYNAAANDFVLTDVLNSVNRLVIKNTGLATYTGYLNVANIAGSQNIQISGTAPAYTIIDTAGSGYAASLGMATVGNNFIQGSVLGDLCLVSQNTIAGNLKLAVGSSNVATINISPNNRVQIGSSVDTGYKFDVTGNINISGSGNAYYLGQTKVVSASGSSIELGNDAGNSQSRMYAGTTAKITAAATLTTLSNTTINLATLNLQLAGVFFAKSVSTDLQLGSPDAASGYTSSTFYVNNVLIGRQFSTGNTTLGSTGDAGYKLDVQNGPVRFGNNLTVVGVCNLNSIVNVNGASQSVTGLNTNRFCASTDAMIGTGAAPDASAVLELRATTKGFLPPRMTTAQKNAIATPATGLVVYDTTLNKLALYTGAAWETVTSI
jgi:hypothetical protein